MPRTRYQSDQSTQRRNSKKGSSTKKTKRIQVPEDKVGLVIGHKAQTVLAIAKDAGDGCKVMHDRDHKGWFDISAWTNKAVLFAECRIQDLVKNASKKKSKKTSTRPQSSTSNSFAALQSQAPVPKTTKGSKKQPAGNLVSCAVTGTIAERKFNNWATFRAPKQLEELKAELKDLEGSAFKAKQREISRIEQQLARHQAKQAKPSPKTERVPTSSDFPSLGGASSSPSNLGAWGQLSQEVKSEAVKPPPPPPVVEDPLEKLEHQEPEEKKEQVNKDGWVEREEKVEVVVTSPKKSLTNEVPEDLVVEEEPEAWETYFGGGYNSPEEDWEEETDWAELDAQEWDEDEYDH